MSNTILSVLLIPTFIALYMGAIQSSVGMCVAGMALMMLIVMNVLLRKK